MALCEHVKQHYSSYLYHIIRFEAIEVQSRDKTSTALPVNRSNEYIHQQKVQVHQHHMAVLCERFGMLSTFSAQRSTG